MKADRTEEQSRALPEVVEALVAFEPPVDLRRAVESLLGEVPPKYLTGLQRVVLRDAGSLTPGEKQKQKRRKRKGKVLLGTYRRAAKGSGAFIVLFADEMTRLWYPWVLRVPFLRDVLISGVLFHEVGHHIHAAVQPRHEDAEEAAERWRRQLAGPILRRRYWYLLPLFKAAPSLGRWIRRMRRKG